MATFCLSLPFSRKNEIANNCPVCAVVQIWRHATYQFIFFSLCSFVFVLQYFHSSWVACIVFWSHSPTPGLDLLSVPEINPDQNQLGKERIYFSFKFTVSCWRSQGGTWSRHHGGMLLTGLLPCHSWFAYTAQDHLLSGGTVHMSHQENAHGYTHRPLLQRQFLCWGSFFPSWL